MLKLNAISGKRSPARLVRLIHNTKINLMLLKYQLTKKNNWLEQQISYRQMASGDGLETTQSLIFAIPIEIEPMTFSKDIEAQKEAIA